MRTSRVLAVSIFILLGCGTALAQAATVSGAVRDQTGGRYRFDRVPPGTCNPRPDIFKLFDEAVSDIDYYFASRLPGEPLEGVSDIHFPPGGAAHG